MFLYDRNTEFRITKIVHNTQNNKLPSSKQYFWARPWLNTTLN